MKIIIHDRLRLLSVFTPARLWNAFKLLAGYRFSRAFGRAVQPALPVSLSVEPTTSCNLRCPECPSGLRSFTRATGMLDPDLFEKVIRQGVSHLCHLTLYFQGEPYLHPQFLELVSAARKHRIYTVTSTNGHYLDDQRARETVESGLDRLIISVDGSTQDAYASYRIGGSLEEVLRGARRVIEWRETLRKKHPLVVFQMLVTRHNEDQVDEFKRIAQEAGVDKVVLKTAQIYDYKQGSPLIPSDSRYSRYAQQPDGTWKIKNSLDDHCWKMWHSFVMTWDGNVVPCCFDKDAHHVMGQLGKETIRAVWHSDKYREFRTRLLNGRKGIDICTNCSEGTKVFS